MRESLSFGSTNSHVVICVSCPFQRGAEPDEFASQPDSQRSIKVVVLVSTSTFGGSEKSGDEFNLRIVIDG